MDISIDEAKKIMAGGLGKAELEFVASITAPLYWIVRRENGSFEVRNGSTFFLDAGNGPFGVTAFHVLDAYRAEAASGTVVACQIGNDLVINFEGWNAVIDEDSLIDIATFKISKAEVLSIGKTVLTGHQQQWPPLPPQREKGVYYCGFPGVERIWTARTEISFGIGAYGGVADSISEIDVSTMIQRSNLIDVMGLGLPPEDYNFGGMSGGPMLTVVDHAGVRSWSLAGVIYKGPNTSTNPNEAIAGLEIIKARRADFINRDGSLDHLRWSAVRPTR